MALSLLNREATWLMKLLKNLVLYATSIFEV